MTDAYLTYSSLDAAAVDITTIKDGLLATLGEVRTEVDGLGTDFHTPSASASFEAAITTYVTEMTKAINNLDGLATFLKGTVDSFTDIDVKLAGALQGEG